MVSEKKFEKLESQKNTKPPKVLIMGLGLHGGGAGAARFFVKQGWRVTVTDLKPAHELAPSLKELQKLSSIRYILGRHQKKDFLKTDLIVKGAGISWNDPLLCVARAKKIPIESDVGIFFELCPAPIIGVTGSKGKSTTASLIALMLKKKYKRVFLAGNIRKSVFDILPYVSENSPVVLELSSWQLEDLAQHKKSPHIAVMTNIMRDHLNKYENFAMYKKAKSLITRYQTKNDYFLINKYDTHARRIAKNTRARIIFFNKPLFRVANSRLQGAHNEANTAAACAAAKCYGISVKKQRAAINEFPGLEGRLEFVVKKRGVRYYNDTTATMPDAAIAALRTIEPDAQGNIILIAGGTDKKLDFKNFAKEIVAKAQTVIWLPGNATTNLKSKILNLKSVQQLRQYNVRSMKEAVAKATKIARAGDIVLLSPGAASFGLFKNEFERGEEFIKWVEKIKS